MTAGEYNITIEQGATFSLSMAVKDIAGAARNLTGYTARMQVRLTRDSATSILELTTENGGITITGATGTIVLSATAAVTAALAFDEAVYDLELISGATVERLLRGKVYLDKEVTR